MVVYCNDDGTNTSPYETLVKAATTFLVAVDQLVAGEDLLIGMDHVETPGSSQTYTFPGTAAAPNRVISIDTTTEAYNKADNVQVDLETNDLTMNGFVKFYGFSIDIGDDTVFVGNPSEVLFDDCLIEFGGSGSLHQIGSDRNIIRHKNTEINFSGGGTNTGFSLLSTVFEMRDGKISWSGTQPIALFNAMNKRNVISFAGVDLSDITSALIDVSDAANITAEFHHCVINSSVSLTTGVINDAGTRILMSGCDDTTGNKLYRLEYVDYYGSIVHDDAIFVTTGGASDGTTPISWKMVTTANAKEFSEPLISPPIPIWIDSTGSKTFTVKGIWDSASDIQNDEAWLEVEFLEASADTDSAFANDGLANILATPADQTNNTETWTGTGGFTNENKIDLAVTVTVNRVGPAICRIHLAKPSTTFYADPKVIVT